MSILSETAPVIGVDFDNTIVFYDDLFHDEALGKGLISPHTPKDKISVQKSVRGLKNGEIKWQELQAAVYGPRQKYAELAPGVIDFFRLCHQRGISTYIVSHKTRFARRDETGTDLHETALDFMEAHGFFGDNGLGISTDRIFFEPTREKKIARIKKIGCTLFIDDLAETFLENSFPEKVEKILYIPQSEKDWMDHIRVCRTWKEIRRHLFPEAG